MCVMICCVPQLISGRLMSPVITTLGVFLFICSIIVLSEIRGGLQGIGDGHWGVGSRRLKKSLPVRKFEADESNQLGQLFVTL